MNDDIESKLELLEKKLDKYEKLDSHKKLSGVSRIQKEVDLCNSMLERYTEILNKPDDHICEVIVLKSKLKSKIKSNEQQFEKYVEEINKIKEEISCDNELTIDEQINMYLNLIFAVKWCREYLRKQHMKVTTVNK